MKKSNLFKVLAPILIVAFILSANVVFKISTKEGTVSFIDGDLYPKVFLQDVAKARKSIKCAIYMFKLDMDDVNEFQKPIPAMAASLVNASKRGIDTAIVMDLGRDDELTTKFNKITGKYLEDNGIKIVFDSPKQRLHTKMCVIDEKIIYIGSHNYTNSAMRYNSEVSTRIVSEELAKDAIKYLKQYGI